MIIFLNQNSGAIQAISTIILVSVTIFYALQAMRAVKEAENSRKDLRLPIIKVRMQGPIINGMEKIKYISFQFHNLGYGLARDITAKFIDKESFSLKNLDIDDGDSFEIVLEEGEEEKINDLRDEEKKIIVEYSDSRRLRKGNW